MQQHFLAGGLSLGPETSQGLQIPAALRKPLPGDRHESKRLGINPPKIKCVHRAGIVHLDQGHIDVVEDSFRIAFVTGTKSDHFLLVDSPASFFVDEFV